MSFHRAHPFILFYPKAPGIICILSGVLTPYMGAEGDIEDPLHRRGWMRGGDGYKIRFKTTQSMGKKRGRFSAPLKELVKIRANL